MPRLMYLVILATASIFCAILLYWSLRSGGERRMWLAWLIAALALLALGILDWVRVAYNETPLTSYVFVAFLPTLLSAGAVRLTVKEGRPGIVVVMLASLLCFLAAFPAIILGMVAYEAALRL